MLFDHREQEETQMIRRPLIPTLLVAGFLPWSSLQGRQPHNTTTPQILWKFEAGG
jgi:hypothetical protein